MTRYLYLRKELKDGDVIAFDGETLVDDVIVSSHHLQCASHERLVDIRKLHHDLRKVNGISCEVCRGLQETFTGGEYGHVAIVCNCLWDEAVLGELPLTLCCWGCLTCKGAGTAALLFSYS